MFLPIGTYFPSQCMLHVLTTHNVFWSYLVVYDHSPTHFCKFLSWKSLWIKAAAKQIHVNVM